MTSYVEKEFDGKPVTAILHPDGQVTLNVDSEEYAYESCQCVEFTVEELGQFALWVAGLYHEAKKKEIER